MIADPVRVDRRYIGTHDRIRGPVSRGSVGVRLVSDPPVDRPPHDELRPPRRFPPHARRGRRWYRRSVERVLPRGAGRGRDQRRGDGRPATGRCRGRRRDYRGSIDAPFVVNAAGPRAAGIGAMARLDLPVSPGGRQPLTGRAAAGRRSRVLGTGRRPADGCGLAAPHGPLRAGEAPSAGRVIDRSGTRNSRTVGGTRPGDHSRRRTMFRNVVVRTGSSSPPPP